MTKKERMSRSDVESSLFVNARKLFLSKAVVEDFAAHASMADIRAANVLLTSELENRKKNKRERLMRKARFPQIKSFDGYDFSQVQMPEGYGVDELKSLAFLDAAQGFVFHGRTGRGKTHLAIAIGVRAINMGRSVRFYSTARLVMSLKKARSEDRLGAALKDVVNAELVVLDEFGYVPIDVQGARLLFQVVSDCYEKRSLIITTNIEFGKWGTVLGDDKLAAAMIDRIAHHSRLVEFNGTSHRMDVALMLGGTGN